MIYMKPEIMRALFNYTKCVLTFFMLVPLIIFLSLFLASLRFAEHTYFKLGKIRRKLTGKTWNYNLTAD